MILSLAWRNIWRNKARSIVIMLSVVTGLLAGISVLALYKGMMKSRIRNVIDSKTGHLQLHHPDFKEDNHPAFILPYYDSITQSIENNPLVQKIAPRSLTQGMLQTVTGSSGVIIHGIVPEKEYAVTSLNRKIIDGEGFHSDKKQEILIGRKLAEKMRLKIASKVVLTFTDSLDNLVSMAFRIVGIYRTANAPLDEVNVFVPINTLNEGLQIGPSVHELIIRLHQDEAVETVKEQLQKAWPGLLVESWRDLSPETELLVQTVDQYAYIIMGIILLALAFGILNTMLMSVLERTREIGMMVALGMGRFRVFQLILIETIFLTLAGTPAGIGIAYILIGYYEKKGLDLSGMGEELMSSFGFDTTIYPYFPWDNLLTVLIMVILTAWISSLLPAWKALQLKPVEALRR
jgi:ABC-type lipoprotein release transport system permease subunit